MTTNASNIKLVYKSSEEVEEHNTKHAELIALGMMEKWEQTEHAKRDEVKDKARQAKADKEKTRLDEAEATLREVNEQVAKEKGMKPITLTFWAHYAPSGSFIRSGPLDGLEVSFGAETKRIYKFSSKTGKIITTSFEKALAEHYDVLAYKAKQREEAAAKAQAASKAMDPELFDKIAVLAKKRPSELNMSMDKGKVAITYTYYPQSYGSRRSNSSYPVNVFTPMTVEQWEKWVAIQETHEAQLAALKAEAQA